MCDLRKPLIACLVAALYLVLLGGQARAYEVSAAGGCSNPDADPDAKGFYDKVKGYTAGAEITTKNTVIAKKPSIIERAPAAAKTPGLIPVIFTITSVTAAGIGIGSTGGT